MSRNSQRHYTVDDYFTVEEMSEVKHAEILIDHFVRIQQDDWQHRSIRNRADILQISDPALAVSVSDIFRRVF